MMVKKWNRKWLVKNRNSKMILKSQTLQDIKTTLRAIKTTLRDIKMTLRDIKTSLRKTTLRKTTLRDIKTTTRDFKTIHVNPKVKIDRNPLSPLKGRTLHLSTLVHARWLVQVKGLALTPFRRKSWGVKLGNQ
jgi:hypothetical protein